MGAVQGNERGDTKNIAFAKRNWVCLSTESNLAMRKRDAGVWARIITSEIFSVDLAAVLVVDEIVSDTIDLLFGDTGFDMLS